MAPYTPLRSLPAIAGYGPNDTLVVFGEVFDRGYANGVIKAAAACGMGIVYGTAGRRDKDGTLRPLTEQELTDKGQSPLVNVPLEAGFDLEKLSDGKSVASEMDSVELGSWTSWTIDPALIAEAHSRGEARFIAHVRKWAAELQPLLGKGHVVFLHTMAGGIPRARALLALTNKIFKGVDERYVSSETFWNSDLGRVCDKSFEAVTANTFQHLIDETKAVRESRTAQGKHVAYLAFGYHGTECLVGGEARWQSYAPYLQGFAKRRLEEIAEAAFDSGVQASVFNSPEVATNSSQVFLGVEMGLYTLFGRLRAEGVDVAALEKACHERLKDGVTVGDIESRAQHYFESDAIAHLFDVSNWPQHNSPEQMKTMCTTASEIIDMHRDKKELVGQLLSEVVINACGSIMLDKSVNLEKPVWWIGHDAVARSAA